MLPLLQRTGLPVTSFLFIGQFNRPRALSVSCANISELKLALLSEVWDLEMFQSTEVTVIGIGAIR